MFISKTEKSDLFYRIGVLEQTILSLRASMKKEAPVKGEKKSMSPENRAKQSERMKQMWVEKKQRWADKKLQRENT